MGDDKQSITAEQVKSYLAEHTDFFQFNPDTLDLMQVDQSPDGTISLAHRQLERA